MYAPESDTDHDGRNRVLVVYLIWTACHIFWRAGVSNGGFCVRPDLASSVVSASLFLSIFLPFPSLPLYLQPPPLPVPPHSTRESGVCLTQPKHTGKVLKKARLRCAFAISSTFLSSHFFSTSFQLISYDCITTSLPPSPQLAKPIWDPSAISFSRHLLASWAPLPLLFVSTSDARSRPSIPPTACASSHQAKPLHWRPEHLSISDFSGLDSVPPPPTFRSASVLRHSGAVDQLAPSVASQ
jgi:hypothetical protein